MYKIIRCLVLYIPCFFIISDISFSQDKNIPWNADVKLADENIKIKNQYGKPVVNVFSAPQGCAYFLIRGFQIIVSPQDGPNCRFNPTCSAYGKIAVLRYGAVIGGFLAGDRILRCNPYNQPGKDPVPKTLFK